jgi:hypothetical protein
MPAGVRAIRSQTMTGFSAATSIPAAWASAAGSPVGGMTFASRGMLKLARSPIGFSCSSASSERTTGLIGGVVANLYARTADSAKCCSDAG